MKNKDKYKTKEEINEAFDFFCRNHKCSRCPLGDEAHCTFAWLELEAKTNTSKDMISALITEVTGIEIGDKAADMVRIEMCTKLLSNRGKIYQIWQEQDREKKDDKL